MHFAACVQQDCHFTVDPVVCLSSVISRPRGVGKDGTRSYQNDPVNTAHYEADTVQPTLMCVRENVINRGFSSSCSVLLIQSLVSESSARRMSPFFPPFCVQGEELDTPEQVISAGCFQKPILNPPRCPVSSVTGVTPGPEPSHCTTAPQQPESTSSLNKSVAFFFDLVFIWLVLASRRWERFPSSARSLQT